MEDKSEKTTLPHVEKNDDFARNLKALCSRYRSVSEVCRLAGINRQQFGKYLKGEYRPSLYNMNLICDMFGIQESDLTLPAKEFEALSRSNMRETQQSSGSGWLGRNIENRITVIDPSLRKYLGWYHSYLYSFGWPNMFIRSLVCVYEHQGRMLSKRIERLKDPIHGARFIYKTDGVVTTGADRIFLVEQDSLHNDGISFVALFPTHRSHVDILSGLNTGTSSRPDRQPTSARVVFEYLGRTIDTKSELRKCGMYVPNHNNINPKILSIIDNTLAEGETAFPAIIR